ncbi:MAG TPA: LysR substrate-binding domain-containing protein [Gammaproteobacteria bacterium]|nr:LysR substrate-binding domain-containing protein [Gammaproteobacteria bacterium]
MKSHLPSDLFAFAQVVAAGGFTKAAKSLDISPSVLSKRIARLESELGVDLLKRTTRTIRLTETGERCLTEIQAMQRQFEEILQKIKRNQHIPEGKLRIASTASFAQTHLEIALWEFHALYPKIKIELVLGQSSIRLMEKNIDVGIFIRDVPDSRLVAKKIGVRKLVVCASPDYFKKHGTPKKPKDLLEHNCLLYRFENKNDLWKFKNTEVNVSGNFSANSSQVLLQAALRGKGIVKLSGYLVSQAIKEKKLESVLEDYCPRDISIYAAYPYARYPSLNVKAFIEFLDKRFRGRFQ